MLIGEIEMLYSNKNATTVAEVRENKLDGRNVKYIIKDNKVIENPEYEAMTYQEFRKLNLNTLVNKNKG